MDIGRDERYPDTAQCEAVVNIPPFTGIPQRSKTLIDGDKLPLKHGAAGSVSPRRWRLHRV